MYCKSFVGFILILFLVINCSAQENDSTGVNASTILPSSVSTLATTTSLETSKPIVLSCPGGHVDAPNCTKCAFNYTHTNGKCFEIKNDIQPTRGSVRRVFLILFACLITTALIITMFVVYGRLNQQRRRRSSSNQGNTSESSNRFNNILRSIGLNNLNKRGRFNFFSISNNNNNNPSSQHRQQDAASSRVPLSENPDEALLFDDPYADGGFNNPSVNPYRSLTLSVT